MRHQEGPAPAAKQRDRKQQERGKARKQRTGPHISALLSCPACWPRGAPACGRPRATHPAPPQGAGRACGASSRVMASRPRRTGARIPPARAPWAAVGGATQWLQQPPQSEAKKEEKPTCGTVSSVQCDTQPMHAGDGPAARTPVASSSSDSTKQGPFMAQRGGRKCARRRWERVGSVLGPQIGAGLLPSNNRKTPRGGPAGGRARAVQRRSWSPTVR